MEEARPQAGIEVQEEVHENKKKTTSKSVQVDGSDEIKRLKEQVNRLTETLKKSEDEKKIMFDQIKKLQEEMKNANKKITLLSHQNFNLNMKLMEKAKMKKFRNTSFSISTPTSPIGQKKKKKNRPSRRKNPLKEMKMKKKNVFDSYPKYRTEKQSKWSYAHKRPEDSVKWLKNVKKFKFLAFEKEKLRKEAIRRDRQRIKRIRKEKAEKAKRMATRKKKKR